MGSTKMINTNLKDVIESAVVDDLHNASFDLHSYLFSSARRNEQGG